MVNLTEKNINNLNTNLKFFFFFFFKETQQDIVQN